MRKGIIFIFLFLTSLSYAANNTPPSIGNFVLPPSQQPGPLVGFGENIVDENQKQLFLFADDYAGINKHFVDVVPGFLYGIKDNLSIFLNAPVAASYKENENHSAGFEDFLVQLEYAYYIQKSSTSEDQATIILGASAPTGSIQKNPATGYGSPSFFLGGTFNRTYVDWLFFASPGGVFTTAKNGTKTGNTYLYQFGFGRNIKDVNGWILAWMAELDGYYSERSRISGIIDTDTGGNIIYLTPSLWASTKKIILQFGVGFPVTQHLYGDQKRDTYLLAANLGWTL